MVGVHVAASREHEAAASTLQKLQTALPATSREQLDVAEALRLHLVLHRHVDRLRAAHPGVEIESCSSGGARIDLEILRRTQRVWTSDCNDALDPSTCRCVNGMQSCKGKSSRCLDDVRTEERIAAALAVGLPTYVIGIQDEGDDALTDVLDSMADAGGRPKLDGGQRYYAARSEGELTSALAVIRDQVGACVYLASSVPDPQGSITVSLGGATIPHDPSGIEGWTWADQANGEIILAGSACEIGRAHV